MTSISKKKSLITLLTTAVIIVGLFPLSVFASENHNDNCEHLMSRFSVTVPSNMALTVSQYGKVFASSDAEIVNNSTADVQVTALSVTSENGWTLVPYEYDMASSKVDSKLIGFTLNGVSTETYGDCESFNPYWTIEKNAALPLFYSANVSAASEPIAEQVLTVVFVLDWLA